MLDTGGQFDIDHVFDQVRGWRPAAPVRAAVYSHHHVDHVFGTARFEAEATERGWPQPVVYAHEDLPGPLPPLRADAGLERGDQQAPVRHPRRPLRLAGRLPLPGRHLPRPPDVHPGRVDVRAAPRPRRDRRRDVDVRPRAGRAPPRRPVHLGRAQRREPAEGAALRQRLGGGAAADGRVRRRDHAVRARPADLRRRPRPPGAHRHRRGARHDRGPDARADEPAACRSTACCTRSRSPNGCASCRTSSRCTTTRSSSCATSGVATAGGTTASRTTCCPPRAPSRPASG